MGEAGKALVRRHFEVLWNERDYTLCDELMAADYVEHGIAPFATEQPGRVNGPEAMRATMKWLIDQFPDVRFTIDALVAEGDLVAVRVRTAGTNLGKLNGFLPPSGRRFEFSQSHWFRIANGQLVEHWATRDDLTGMLQMRVVAPPRLGALLRQLLGAATRRRRR